MQQHIAERHAILAVRGEFGPDIGDALLVAQLATVDECVRDRRRNALARGCGEEQGARSHGLCRPRIGESGNRVHDNFALMRDRDLKPGLATGGDELVDRGLNLPLRVDRQAHAGNRQVV
ncbi:MAG TPA: hypothetical protein VHK65_01390 [Candidatus Dormibacteraeota bacterium]|nr:hypothetical protein [Candidatus Dormibacteraeota bacterium]